ncbi:MAG: divalent-cation tolerance protein CutA [Desulfobacteraceae bacterium]|nr:divalent-cation tolerance protein CutA [Desulfobacteraceae bacterium]
MSEISIVLMTAGNEEEAAKIGWIAVEERLAACANIVPRIRSIYRWKDEIHDDPEALVIFKTRTELFPALQARIRELHGYEVPEIIAFPLDRGLPEYLDWVVEQTGKTEQPKRRGRD